MSSAGTVSITTQILGAAQAISDLNSVKTAVTGVKTESDKAATSVETAGDKIKGAGDKSATAATKIKDVGAGMALAASSAVALWNAYDNVSDSAKKVDIAETGVVRAENTLSKARERLTNLQNSGTATALDLKQAQDDVTSAEGRLERAQLLLTNSQEALNESWANSATNIIPSVFTGISGLSMAYKGLGGSSGKLATSLKSLIPALTGAGVAGAGAVGKLGPLGSTMSSTAVQAGGLRGALSTLPAALGLTATAGTSAVGALGPLGATMGASGASAGGLSAAMAGVGSAIAAVAVPIGIAAGALAAWGGLLVAQQKNVGGFGDAMTTLTNAVHNLAGAVPGLQSFFDAMVQNNAASRETLVTYMQGIPIIGDWIKGIDGAKTSTTDLTAQTTNLAGQQNLLNMALGAIHGIMDGVTAKTNAAATSVANYNTQTSLLGNALTQIRPSFDALITAFSGIEGAIRTAIGTVGSNLSGLISGFIQETVNKFAQGWNFLQAIGQAFGSASGLGGSIRTALGSAASGISSAISGWITETVGKFATGWDFSSMVTSVKKGLIGAISDALAGAKSWVETTGKGIWEGIVGFFTGGMQEAHAEEATTPPVQKGRRTGKGHPAGEGRPLLSANAPKAFGFGQGPGAAGPTIPPPDFSEHITKWQEYQTQVQQFITNITTSYTALNTALTTTAAQIGVALGGIIIAWGGHVIGVQAQVTAVGQQLILMVQGYGLLAQQIGVALGGIMIAWAGHVVGITAQVMAVGQQLIMMVTGYGLLAQQIGVALAQIVVLWAGHVAQVTAQVNAMGLSIVNLITAYATLIQGAQQTQSAVVGSFSAMQGSVTSSVNTMGQGIINLISAMGNLITGAQKTNTSVSSSFGTMSSTSSNHVRNLASAVSSSMSKIVSSMNTATAAAKRLKASIDALKNKTITVTTNYVTKGRSGGGGGGSTGGRAIGGQHGLDTVVSQPTTLMVGEGFKPEHVRVTPLAGSAMSSVSNAGGHTIMRAGKGAKKSIVRTEYYQDGYKITYFSDGTKKKKRYDIRKGERWESAVARDSGEPYVRDIGGRGDYRTPSGMRYKSEDMYKFEEEERQAVIKAAEEKEQRKAQGKNGKAEKPPTTTYTTVTKKGKVKKKEVEIDPETGAAKKGSAETTLQRMPMVFNAPPPERSLYMGRYGKGGIWMHAAHGGEGDIFPFPLPPGFKKTISKTYYPDGSVWNNYSDGSREMIRPARDTKKNKNKKKKKGQFGYSGIVRNPTEFTAGEGGRPERVSIEPLSGGGGQGAGAKGGRWAGQSKEITITVPLYVDGKQMARAIGRHTLEGISSFT